MNLNVLFKVLNCVSARGIHIPLGTFNYLDDGINYSCKLHLNEDFEFDSLFY
jgi:hypothetical protein